jgi:hypothetical protein
VKDFSIGFFTGMGVRESTDIVNINKVKNEISKKRDA